MRPMTDRRDTPAFGTPDLPAQRIAVQKSRPKEAVREISFTAFTIRMAASCVLTWGLIWAYVSAFPMAYQDRDYPLSIAKAALAAQCRPNVVAVFGDSRAVAGVLPAAMPIPTENFALSGTSPVETYFMVKQLLRCPSPPRLVVIAHSASNYAGDGYFWEFDARTGFLNTSDIRSVEADARRLGDDDLQVARHAGGLPYGLLASLYEIHFPPLYFASLINGYVAGRWQYNQQVVRDVLASSGHALFGTADGSDDVADEATMPEWRVSPLVNLYLNRTLALLGERKVPVVILTMPVNEATCHRMSPSLQQGFSTYLGSIGQTYPGVVMANPVISCWPNRFYGDAWHFNQSGAGAFSRYLQSILAVVLQGRGTRGTAVAAND